MKQTAEQLLREAGLAKEALPKHVGIIMDGNGRWAQAQGLPRSAGHRAGVERLRGIIRLSSDLGIQALSLYAFSTENWKRPQAEVSILCGLLVEYFTREIEELHENQVCIRVLGDYGKFPKSVVEAIQKAEERTRYNTGLKLNIALNYGSQAEILRAVTLLAEDLKNGVITEIQPSDFEERLYTKGLPALDLVIRTSGEQRLSNFLMYQAAYAELIFAEEYWPAFTDACYIEALQQYQKRTRRYGGL